ncbi:MAG TPA: ATP-dependent DNA helicase RecG [bacterium]|nr:ATP-dependent DNA helicase RecG [bacterium]
MPESTPATPAAPARASDRPLDTSLRYLPGVGPKRAERLDEGLGLRTVGDLLYRPPRRVEDRRTLHQIYDLTHGAVESVEGTVGRVRAFRVRRRRNFVIVKAAITDGSGVLHAVWYNQGYIVKQLPAGARVILHGRVQRQGGEIQMIAPEFEILEPGEDTLHAGRIVPVYGATEGVTQRVLRAMVMHALDEYAAAAPDWLPDQLRDRYAFPPLAAALRHLHFPETEDEQRSAHQRLAYEELLLFQTLLLRHKQARRREPKGIRYGDAADLLERFEARLPYRLTRAQRRVVNEIAHDMGAPHPMNRLLQGDVGSGKTVVAAEALLRSIGGGAQGALMAPTEILAGQHYLTLRALLDPIGVTVVLLIGGLSRAARVEALDLIRGGGADLVVGTHALIEEDVAFARLGLVVVDEQHRFGVAQRAALRAKGARPDVLVMTATPIPRTLALSLYGDLDVSVIDELPPGRAPIRTYVRAGGSRPQIYPWVAEQVREGRQAYVVCPLIEESDKLQAEAATGLAARLAAGPLAGLRVEVLHGRMKVDDRDRIMRELRAGAIDVLVATTVIEVGIDVPNATIMVIEDADRFGLSQLHQLRGRVGRGPHPSHCVLVADPKTEDGGARLEAMRETTDGFHIAQRDLELRGIGELLGETGKEALRQHGLRGDLRIANLVRDHEWLERARADAAAMLVKDPALRQPDHRPVAEAVRERFAAAPVENVRVG